MSAAKAKKMVTVIGYGSQGRAIALNLRDSGYHVVLGLRPKSKSAVGARREIFTDIRPIGAAVNASPIVIVAIPDHVQARVFKADIAPSLSPGSTLVFLHGLSVHFGLVKPPPNVAVVLIAPHAPGVALREKYLGDRSVSAFVAVAHNHSGNAWRTAAMLAGAIGISPKRQIKTTFEHEAIGDIFGEQAVLCGGLAMLIKHGFDTLVEHGIPPDNAWLEVAYQLDLIVGLIKQHGISGMFDRISVAARYGSLKSAPRIVNSSVKKQMTSTLREIESGQFARSLSSLSDRDLIELRTKLAKLTSPKLERSARKFGHRTR